MLVLVDTSIWIDYFKEGHRSSDLDMLIDENVLVTNDLILAELIPFIKEKRQTRLIQLLNKITRIPIEIDWEEIIEFQVKCLKGGANGIGIPDLIIAQNAKTNKLRIYSLDKHFKLLSKLIKIDLYSELG
jgi:predicted nucleic acid-binding protein